MPATETMHAPTTDGSPPGISRMARYVESVAPLLIIFARGCKEAIGNVDTWFHLSTGRWIWEHHAVPHVDPFSFTAADHAYVAHEWLWEVLTYGIWRYLGPTGVILARSVMLVLIYLALQAACRRRCGDQGIVIAAVFLGLLSFAGWWSERPQLVTYLFTALLAMELHRYKERPARRIWWLPAVFPIWANMHGGYFFGLALIGYYAAVLLVEHRPESRTLFLVLGLSALAATANPYGVHALTYPFWYLGKHRAIDFVEEWVSPDFHQVSMIPFQVLIIVSMAAFALSPRRPRVPDIALFFLLLRMSLYSCRNISLVALVCVPMVAEALEPMVARWSRDRAQRPSPLLQSVILVSSVGLLLLYLPLGHRPRVNEGDYGKAVSFLQEHKLGGRLCIDQGAGALAIWRLWPRYRVMIDGRLDIYGDRILKDYEKIERGGESSDGLLAQYRVETVACDQDGPLAHVLGLQPEVWALAYRDKHACVFARR